MGHSHHEKSEGNCDWRNGQKEECDSKDIYPCVRRVGRGMDFSRELWSAPAEPALGAVGVSTGQGPCRGFTQVPAKAAHWAQHILNPISTKPVQLQLNKTGIFHCCNIFYFLTGDVGTSNPVCSQAEQDGRTLSSEGN